MIAEQLIEVVFARFDGRISRRDIMRVLSCATDIIIETVPTEPVFYPRLGVFRLVLRRGMTVTSPVGSKHVVPDRQELKFRPFKHNRRKVQ